MKDQNKTKSQLISELTELRQRIISFEEVEPYSDCIDRQQAEMALRLLEEKFSKAFQSTPEPITITALEDGHYIEVNDAWVETTGYERLEVIGHTPIELGIWLGKEERLKLIREIQGHGSIRNFPATFCMKTGEIRSFLVSAEIIDMGDKPHLLCVHKDITDRTRIQAELSVSEERFSKAFNASPTTISITTLDEGRYIDINESFCRIIGYHHDEILGRTSLEMGFWVDPNDRLKVLESIVRKEPVREMEILFRRKFGEQRLGLYSAEGIDIDNTPCLLSIVTDITERRQAEEDVKFLLFHDKLTGLYNRTYFEEEIKRRDNENQLPISLILADVNGLKLVNDVLGHQEGDKVLITVAEVLKVYCRPEDIVARWGGDEFIILLPECDANLVSRLSERIKKACQHINDLPIDTSLSVGLASKNEMRQDIMELIKEAEDKMYRNKLLVDRSTRSSFLTSLKKTLWTRSHETQAHCQRMQAMAQKLGQAIKLPSCDLDNLSLLAVLHDIGKIAIPNSILDKPDKLTMEEWEFMKKHPEIGYRIALSSPEMAPIAEAVLHHHERWDGKGYPLRLKGEQIPLISRVIAIVDTCDVMIYGRPYQKAYRAQEVWVEIEKCSGTQFDPYIARQALDLFAG
ncbi:MAG TPA: diguanylate cyclase [Syntrophomonadaceae bacterium]|nr:diguanylate cyclase [Syntrophomonadaceae bacterium]